MKSPSPSPMNNCNSVKDDNNNLSFDSIIFSQNEYIQFISWINKLEYDTDSLLYDL